MVLMTPGHIVMMLDEMGGLRLAAISSSLDGAIIRIQGQPGCCTRFLQEDLTLFGANRRFSAVMRRMKARSCESMHGLPGRRRERRLQYPRHPSRSQWATVAGSTSTSASLHHGGKC
jgi:hypothetical protein